MPNVIIRKKAVPARVPPPIQGSLPKSSPARRLESSILQVFWNVNMSTNPDGLAAIAKKYGDIDVNSLEPGNYLVFINSARTFMKVLAGTSTPGATVIAYYRQPKGRIDLQAIQYVPEAFLGKGFNYNQALRISLEERLGIKGQGVEVSLH